MAPGVKQAPMFEPKVFRDHIYCVEEMYSVEGSTCDVVGTLRRPERCNPLALLGMPPWHYANLPVDRTSELSPFTYCSGGY